MRRIPLIGLTLVFGCLLPSGPAIACNGDLDNGTIPTTPRMLYTIAVPGTNLVFYVDDRDYLDLDEDGNSGGLWVYMESNGVEGLQTGGEQYLLKQITVPHQDPISTGPVGLPEIQVVPPNPVLPQGVTLFPGGMPIYPGVTIFPSGFGGGSAARAIGAVDTCEVHANPDTLIF